MLIWWREIEITRDKSQPEAVSNWIWIAVGVMGNLMFGAIHHSMDCDERKRKSTMPRSAPQRDRRRTAVRVL